MHKNQLYDYFKHSLNQNIRSHSLRILPNSLLCFSCVEGFLHHHGCVVVLVASTILASVYTHSQRERERRHQSSLRLYRDLLWQGKFPWNDKIQRTEDDDENVLFSAATQPSRLVWAVWLVWADQPARLAGWLLPGLS